MEQKLKHIATLTNSNNHTGARWHMADLFPYLSLYKRRFDLISELQSLDGKLIHGLSLYRNEITHDMLKEIHTHESKETLEAIQEVL